jgi:hypothetical protein
LIRPRVITARVTRWRLRFGRAHESWPGITISGVVILASAVIADAFGEPPRGGPRLYLGLGIGAVVLVLGYALRRIEGRHEGDRDAP